MPLTPIDVQRKTFGQALRGYDLDEVDDFLDEVVTALNSYEERLAEANRKIAELESDMATRGDSESAISRALVAAQRSADMIVEEAKAEADRLVADSRAQVEVMQAVRDEERAKLDAEVAGIRSRVSTLRERVRDLAASVDADIDKMDTAMADATAGLGGSAPVYAPEPIETAAPPAPDPEDVVERAVAVADAGAVPPEDHMAIEVGDEVVASTLAFDDVDYDAGAHDDGAHDAGAHDDVEVDPLEAVISEATFAGTRREEVVLDLAAPDLETDEVPADASSMDDGPEHDTAEAWERAGFGGFDQDSERVRRPWERS